MIKILKSFFCYEGMVRPIYKPQFDFYYSIYLNLINLTKKLNFDGIFYFNFSLTQNVGYTALPRSAKIFKEQTVIESGLIAIMD